MFWHSDIEHCHLNLTSLLTLRRCVMTRDRLLFCLRSLWNSSICATLCSFMLIWWCFFLFFPKWVFLFSFFLKTAVYQHVNSTTHCPLFKSLELCHLLNKPQSHGNLSHVKRPSFSCEVNSCVMISVMAKNIRVCIGIFTTALKNKNNIVKFSITIPHLTSKVHCLLSDCLLCQNESISASYPFWHDMEQLGACSDILSDSALSRRQHQLQQPSLTALSSREIFMFLRDLWIRLSFGN